MVFIILTFNFCLLFLLGLLEIISMLHENFQFLSIVSMGPRVFRVTSDSIHFQFLSIVSVDFSGELRRGERVLSIFVYCFTNP